MALHPVDGVLYLSDPEAHQIIRIKNMDDYSDPDNNWETFIGSGERCLPGDESKCGDGGLGRDARLAYPKGDLMHYSSWSFPTSCPIKYQINLL